MNYKTFEELPCWQRARELCRVISGVVNQKKFRQDYSLRDQIWRAAGSVMDNIAEASMMVRPENLRVFWVMRKDRAEKSSRSYTAL